MAQLWSLGEFEHMKRIYVALITVSALLVGGVAGFYFASYRYAHAVTDTIDSYELLRASDVFTTLRHLRAGNTNAVFDSLERDLDTSVISLNAILEVYPTVDRAKHYRNLFRRIGDYRATFAYHTNMDADVIEILAKARKESQ